MQRQCKKSRLQQNMSWKIHHEEVLCGLNIQGIFSFRQNQTWKAFNIIKESKWIVNGIWKCYLQRQNISMLIIIKPIFFVFAYLSIFSFPNFNSLIRYIESGLTLVLNINISIYQSAVFSNSSLDIHSEHFVQFLIMTFWLVKKEKKKCLIWIFFLTDIVLPWKYFINIFTILLQHFYSFFFILKLKPVSLILLSVPFFLLTEQDMVSSIFFYILVMKSMSAILTHLWYSIWSLDTKRCFQ